VLAERAKAAGGAGNYVELQGLEGADPLAMSGDAIGGSTYKDGDEEEDEEEVDVGNGARLRGLVESPELSH
jgi:hypothetical protein